MAIKFENKFSWLLKNLWHCFVASVRIFIFCILNPKAFFDLLFSFYSTLNEFYQLTHGKLIDFKETQLWEDMEKEMVFAKVNYLNMDKMVMRAVEVEILAAVTKYLKPRTIFEIGTYGGFTTLHFAHNTDETTKIYTLDLPANYVPFSENGKLSYDDKLVIELSQKNINNRSYRGTPHEKRISELFGDSMHFDYAPYKNKMDLIFIDGNHSYEYVKSDTENALAMLSERGVIIWHDFDYIMHREVFKYLNQLSNEKRIYAIRDTRYAIFGWDL